MSAALVLHLRISSDAALSREEMIAGCNLLSPTQGSARRRSRKPPQALHACASNLLQSDQVVRQRREMRGNKVYGGAETWRAAEYMCRCWPGHRKFGELHVGQVDRTTHHQQSRGQLTRASRGELQREQRLARRSELQRLRTYGHQTVRRHRSSCCGAAQRGWSERSSVTGGDGARCAAAAGGSA